ncbi:PREDICTED: GDSL esterase/lipase At1g29660-like [Tarenaya hassleriana]|uniref:GDSL esterase/lipase At1g29660-like n=1 Tax=Tarenaya hassleriana TaxID=28532 RepID=UPI00053C6C8D|nr:PREDICTED: GDSL esterase/lipase At1g29660-like [Tarenaya hassleriana]
MDRRMMKWYMVFVGLVLGFRAQGAPQVPCAFIFGDSLCDNGNNNKLRTIARADYSPYGIDFPQGSTGRFCNGRTIIDFMTEFIGLDRYLPPYSESTDEDVLTGVNYASASAGIREESGRQLGERITFREQVEENHREMVSRVVNMLGGDKNAAANHLGKCLYSIEMGNNDYLNNYFSASYPTRKQYTPEQFADNLIDLYGQQLNVLYSYGARKFVLSGVGAIGCCPNVLARFSPDGKTCVEFINYAVRLFNDKLKSLVDQLNNDLADAKFIYANNYDILQDLLNNPSAYGFNVTNEGCCGSGRNRGLFQCLPRAKPCPNRNEYVFWDVYHPTEAANAIIAQRLYRRRDPSDIYPVDVFTLANL